MKKKVVQWIGGMLLSSVTVLIYLILFHTYLFSHGILSSINQFILLKNNLEITGQFQGSILGNNLGLKNISLRINPSSDPLFEADKMVLSDWDYNWESQELVIAGVELSHYTFNTQYLPKGNKDGLKQANRTMIVVDQIQANQGQLFFEMRDSLTSISLDDLRAKFWLIDGFLGLSLTDARVCAPDIFPDTVNISGRMRRDTQGNTHVNSLQLRTPNYSMSMKGQYTGDSLSVELKGQNFPLSRLSKPQFPSLLSEFVIDYDADLQWTPNDVVIRSTGSFNLHGSAVPFELRSFTKSNLGETLDLTIGTEFNNIDLRATRDTLSYLYAVVDLFRFNFKPFMSPKYLSLTDPIGQLTFQGDMKNVDISARMESFVMNDLRFDSLVTELSVDPSGRMNISKAEVKLSKNSLRFSGSVSKDSINLSGKLTLSDFSFFREPFPQHQIGGEVVSDIKILGSLQEPHITGVFRPNSLHYGDRFSLTGLGKIDLLLKNDGVEGDFALVGDQGLFLGDSVQSYTILANISNNAYILEDLNIQGKNNLLSLSGRSDPSGFELDKLHLIADQNQMKLADSIKVTLAENGLYYVPESILTFNQGGLRFSGQYDPRLGIDVQLDYELINIEQILKFLKLDIEFAGIANGTGRINGSLNDPIFHMQLELNNGLTLGYPSDSARIDLTLASSSIISKRIEAFSKEGSLVLMGKLPWGYLIKGNQIGDTQQNFSINLDNYLLSDLKFTSFLNLPISGRTSGSISIRGTPHQTKLDGQLEISSAKFDTLSFTKAYTEFVYEDNLLTIDSLSMISTWGYGSGAGFMPVTLDLIAGDRMAVANRDMGLDFDFDLNKMPFLTSYISTIDGIEGDFSGNLSFTGPLLAPIRNGKVRGHDANLTLSVLGNPITNIYSEITLKDNTLSIDHFSGRMQFTEWSNLNTSGILGRATNMVEELLGVNADQTYAGEISAFGNIDLESFFHPRFDIRLSGREIYYRSTDGLIEAIADVDAQLTGQDTLDITAVVPVRRAVYYANFETVESYQQAIGNSENQIFTYSLNTQYASDLIISNDQMEAEFEGELWLLDYGDGLMRFTGTLTAIEGGKFFYLGNELTILSGEIIFNSVDFNPQLNMVAEVDIEGERVFLTLSGDMTEPELAIKAENTQLTQSDVLTYLTINQKEVSFDKQSALNPAKTLSEIYVEKQISRIAREISGLDILNINIASDVNPVSSFQLGHRLSKNLKVTGALQPTTDQTDYDFGFEYQINRNISITSRINQDNEVELNGRFKFTY